MQNTQNYTHTHTFLLRRPSHYQRGLCFWGFHGYYALVMSKRYRWNSFSVNSPCFIITCILLGSQEHGFNRHGLERCVCGGAGAGGWVGGFKEVLIWQGGPPSFKGSSGKHRSEIELTNDRWPSSMTVGFLSYLDVYQQMYLHRAVPLSNPHHPPPDTLYPIPESTPHP